MSRLAGVFSELRQQGKTALVPYLTAGDPHPEHTVEFMHALVDSGANILELGVPFSDPMADGPVIQAACERALVHNVGLRQVLTMVSTFRQKDQVTPIVLMGYANPIEVMRYAVFADLASKAGVDGLITVDLPPEESSTLLAELEKVNIDPIYLLSPTSTDKRIEKIVAAASGFVYYVSLKGVTGAASLDVSHVETKLQNIRRHTGLPVGVGFGIKDATTAASVGQFADAVVVGSAIIRKIADNIGHADEAKRQMMDLIKEMRLALDKKPGLSVASDTQH